MKPIKRRFKETITFTSKFFKSKESFEKTFGWHPMVGSNCGKSQTVRVAVKTFESKGLTQIS